jgi:AcrR family transcriptional regulator
MASDARTRLLATAGQIFYSEGIHSIGVDRIIGEAGVTRATFYRHFPAKDDLVVAYLADAHRAEKAQVDAAIAANRPPADTIRGIAEGIAKYIQSRGFRGCAFLNAVAEYPNPGHPVHRAVIEHRQWFLDTINSLFARIDLTTAEASARHFVMLRDGAMAAGCLFDTKLIRETFLHGVDGLVAA